jgi:cysteine desulfuration protein SufE
LNVAAALDDLAAEFDLLGELGDWEERYHYVIELGRGLTPLSEAEKTAANEVRGCVSKVWLITEPHANGMIRFRADSDGQISKGLIAILTRLLSGQSPEEILSFDAKAAFERLGLREALTPQRSNGFFSMVERIRRDARAAAVSVD